MKRLLPVLALTILLAAILESCHKPPIAQAIKVIVRVKKVAKNVQIPAIPVNVEIIGR